MPDDGRSISRNVASLNILVHDVINLLHYEHWTDKRKYFYAKDTLFETEIWRQTVENEQIYIWHWAVEDEQIYKLFVTINYYQLEW